MMYKILSLFKKEWPEFLLFCRKVNGIYLYGAGKVAEEIYRYCCAEKLKVNGVVVSNNAVGTTFHGLPVYDVERLAECDANAGVVLAVAPRLHGELIKELENIHFKGLIYAQHMVGANYKDVDTTCFLPYFKVKDGCLAVNRENTNQGCFFVHKELDKWGGGLRYR